jgi:acyl transferase domain-containing protein
MGKGLLRSNSIARATIKLLDGVLDTVDSQRSWTLYGKPFIITYTSEHQTDFFPEELLRPESSSRVSKAEYSQSCCTAIQIVLVDILKSLNLRPSAVIGHSAGEIAAAYAAGALSAAEAITIAYHRGQTVKRAEGTGRGGMVAVSLGRQQASRFLVDGVTIACENSPKSVTLSGDIALLDVVAAEICAAHPDAMVKRLPVQCAYHSGMWLPDIKYEHL